MGENTESYNKYDFFVSFADDAKEWVYGVLVPKLGRTGKTFILVGEITGDSWVDDLQTNIEASKKILVVVTPQYCTSQRNHLLQLMAFTKGAEQREWPVIPLLLKSVDLELFLRFINAVNLIHYQSEEQLDVLFSVPPLSQEEQEQLEIPPYPGMAAFKEEDANRFFGREDEIDYCVKKLVNESILVLTGASGCGKSSLARAGIIPRLKEKHHFLVKTVRPIDNDLESWLEQTENALKDGAESAKRFFSLKRPDQSFLLFIDQFEEVFFIGLEVRSSFTLSTKAQQLLSILVKLKKQAPNFNLLITLRAEFYPQLALCQAYINFDNYLHRISGLKRENLSIAITKPALDKGVFIDERLVERLLNEAGEEQGILPFVQETMRDLWEKRIEFYIDVSAYERSNSGLKASIATKADAAYKELPSDKHRMIAKRIFIRLIQFGEGKPDTRRQQAITALTSDHDTAGVFEQTLQHLCSNRYRLLTVSRERNDDDSKVDLVHETLIRAWPMLQEWIISLKDIESSYRYLSYLSDKWQKDFQGKFGFLSKQQLNFFEKKWSVIREYGVSAQVELYYNASISYNRYLIYKKIINYILLLSLFIVFIYMSWLGYVFFLKKQ